MLPVICVFEVVLCVCHVLTARFRDSYVRRKSYVLFLITYLTQWVKYVLCVVYTSWGVG